MSPDTPYSSSASVVRDSAGVRIAEDPPVQVVDTVPEEPVLTIGRMGDPEYDFSRANGVFLFGSAELVGRWSGFCPSF